MDINLEYIMQILVPVLTILLGALSAYLRGKEKLRYSAIDYITQAEEMYKDVTKAGGQKFAWVVDTLYNLVPNPLKIIIPLFPPRFFNLIGSPLPIPHDAEHFPLLTRHLIGFALLVPPLLGILQLHS
jgi:hypothetical protein